MNTSRFVKNSSIQPTIAPAIKSNRLGHNHNGIVYKTTQDTLKLLHFAWDHDLRNDDYDNSYSLAVINITDSEATYLASYVENIAAEDENSRIPYHIEIDDSFFSKDGKWYPIDRYSGLTCATFVLNVFKSAGFPLAELINWPIRHEDTASQSRLVEFLKHTNSDQAAIQFSKIGQCPRIRPEEVIGASLQDDLPATYQQAESNGLWVLSQILNSEDVVIDKS